jgi:ion channel-forming bestrophin family protein
MLTTQDLSLKRFIAITWRSDVLMLIVCTIAYTADRFIFGERLQVPGTLPALLGTAIAFFIGFNNNQAYSRWWEARTIWGGLVNDSRSWARHILYYLPSTAPNLEQLQREMIHRHIAFVYALRSSLRRANDTEYTQYLDPDEAARVAQFANVPNAILDEQAKALRRLYEAGCVDGFRFNDFNSLIVNFCDHMGRSERINTTIYPATYVYFTKVCIWLFVILTTLAVADTAHVWSILFGTLLGFVYFVTHINGQSLMNPFQPIATGVPLNAISRTIEINLLQALGEKDVPKPIQPFNGEFLL